ncbi:uncharacterized protein LOC109200623 [Oreochromis niloticus]|uniref:uncharacterized protein LOC109200623 n=1 Tax=Oreochromis niloticus TaxID=8128 RepID=UPI000DF410FE|nr:uncharacterized protein LOC109200623 [Oreochromis niloticus]
MPTYATDGEWTLVRRRRGRRGDRDWRAEEIARRPPRRSSYPSREAESGEKPAGSRPLCSPPGELERRSRLGADEDARRPPRRSSHPSREGRRTYAAVVREEHRNGQPGFFHAPQRNRGRDRPAPDRYAARQESWRGDRGWRAEEDVRRPPRRSSYPSREGRRTYAAAVGEDHRSDEPDFFHAPQRSRRGEQPATDRYAARQGSRTGRDRRFERRTARDNRYVRRTRAERAGPPVNKIISDDPDFSKKVRIIHRLIKTVHHLKNVTSDTYPPSLNKIAHNLKTVIKPAVPTKHTQNKIEENAKNWARTTMVILRQHYTQSVEEELKALSECSKQDWEGPFEIATSWAKRNLGRRLQPDSLEQARAEIVAKLGDLGTATSTEEGPPAPRTTSKTTTATMTDHVAGDWSPSSEMEQEQERDLTPSSPPESSQPAEPNLATPKEQRVLRFAASIPETPSQERPCSPSTQPPQSGEMMDTEGLDLTQGEVTPKKTKRVNTLTVAKPQPVSHPGPSRSGLDRLTSCVQTRLQLQAAEEESSSSSSLPPSPASPGQQVRTPTRHPNTHRKLRDWHLHVKEPWLVVGDSNVSRLPPFAADSLQIDGFPGAKWWHAEYLLEKATIATPVTKLILSFGINNRSQRDKNMPVVELKRALKVARQKFPEANIYVPEINFSSALPQVEKDTLMYLNTFITGLKDHIPALTSDIFTTEEDDIHWSYGTSEAMLQHWEMYVNGESP